jgi:Icc-related predicted phosphoesterase
MWLGKYQRSHNVPSGQRQVGALIFKMKILAIGDFHGKFPVKLKKLAKSKEIDLVLCTGDFAGVKQWIPLLKKMFDSLGKGENFSIEEYLGRKKYKDLLKKDFSAGERILRELNKLKKKVICVFGNGDWYKRLSEKHGFNKTYEPFMKKLKNLKSINRGKAVYKKIKIVGFGGYLNPDVYFTTKGKKAINDSVKQNKKRKKEYILEEKRLMKLMKSKPAILLTHYTPYKCLDKMNKKNQIKFSRKGYMGVSSFNRAIRKFKPILVICGHMHENQGKCKMGKTFVVNPGAAVDGKASLIDFDEKKKKVGSVKFIK